MKPLILLLLSDLEGKPIPEDPLTGDWVTGVLILILGMLSWVRASYPKRLRQIGQCVVAPRFIRQVMREEWVFSHRASVVMLLNFVLIGGLFLFQVQQYYGWEVFQGPDWIVFLKNAGLLVAVYLSKFVLIMGVRFVVGDDVGFSEYLFSLFLFNKAIGLLFLPLVIVIAYFSQVPADYFFVTGLTVFSLFLVYRLFRGVFIGFGNNVSPFYLILYLCTLEILPLVVVLKLFVLRI